MTKIFSSVYVCFFMTTKVFPSVTLFSNDDDDGAPNALQSDAELFPSVTSFSNDGDGDGSANALQNDANVL